MSAVNCPCSKVCSLCSPTCDVQVDVQYNMLCAAALRAAAVAVTVGDGGGGGGGGGPSCAGASWARVPVQTAPTVEVSRVTVGGQTPGQTHT